MKFDTPGAFGYLCAFHKFQRGTVIVEPETVEGLPTQEDIDSEAARQIAVQELTTDRGGGAGVHRLCFRQGGEAWRRPLDSERGHGAAGGGGPGVRASPSGHQPGGHRGVDVRPVPCGGVSGAGRRHTAVLPVRGAGAGSTEYRDQSSGAVACTAVRALRRDCVRQLRCHWPRYPSWRGRLLADFSPARVSTCTHVRYM